MIAKGQPIKFGLAVFGVDGKQVGRLAGVLLHKAGHKMTHVVVDAGLVEPGHHFWEGGLGLTHDRLIDLTEVACLNHDCIDLTIDGAEFARRAPFTRETAQAPADYSPGQLDASDLVTDAAAMAQAINNTSEAWLVPNYALPAEAVAIRDGTQVWTVSSHHKVGEVTGVIVDGEMRVSAVILRRDGLFQPEVVLTLGLGRELADGVIHVDANAQQIEQLPVLTPTA